MRGDRTVAATLIVLLLTGCTMPVVGEDSYRREVEVHVSALLSAVRTGVMAAHLWRDDRSLPTHLETAVFESESDARSAADAFASLQPPTRSSDTLREDVGTLATGAENGLADLRIALRRGDAAAATRAEGALTDVGERLESVQESLR